MRAVGRNVRRKDAVAKVTGTARYVDDLTFPGMLHAATVRSPVACGEVTGVRLDLDDGFVVVDHRDVPGRNVVLHIDDDQPCLVEREVRHPDEAILIVAHPDRERLREAVYGPRPAVRVDIRPGTPQTDPEAATRFFRTFHVDRGRLDDGFAAAHAVIEGTYRTGAQEQAYLENHGVIAVPGEDGAVTVYGSLQCPYFVHKALKALLGLPADKVRVVQCETGGAFGGKEDYPSMIAGHAALVALKARRPVKLVYDRAEDLAATTKRHPSIVRHRTGVTRDGRLLAMDIDVLFDGGAYSTMSPVVLSRGVLHATGPYRCPNVRIRGRAAVTHTPPAGAFRGFGAPQTEFAVEVHMDRIAESLGLDPVRVREANVLRAGDETATGQVLGEDTAAADVLREAVRRTDFRRRRRALAGKGRGLGLALFWHGAGFTGSGETRLASRASLELTRRGARVLVANTEMGQGARTVLCQIVADALRIDIERVDIAPADTALVPDSGPTVASRTTMVVGGLLERCAAEMRARLGKLSPATYLSRHGPLVVTHEYVRPPGQPWDEDTYQGAAYGTYAWGCDVAEVALDRDTYEVKPVAVTAVVEIGKAIHPCLARGQVEGGTVQGLGWALLERVVHRDGRVANASLTDYIVPTTLDTPPVDVVLLERPYAHGPYGAKGLGELPMDGPAPAVVNAIRHLGLDVRDIPATPERIMEASCASR